MVNLHHDHRVKHNCIVEGRYYDLSLVETNTNLKELADDVFI